MSWLLCGAMECNAGTEAPFMKKHDGRRGMLCFAYVAKPVLAIQCNAVLYRGPFHEKERWA